MVTEGQKDLITVIYSFAGKKDLADWLKTYEIWLDTLGGAKDIRLGLVR